MKSFLLISALALVALASGCHRFDPVPGMEGLPKELTPYARTIASSKLAPDTPMHAAEADSDRWASNRLASDELSAASGDDQSQAKIVSTL